MGGKGNAAAVLAAVEHVVAREEWVDSFVGFQFPYGFYGPQEYLPWLAEAGLRAVRVELIAKDMVHADAEAFAGWVRRSQPAAEELLGNQVPETVALAAEAR